MQLITRSPLTGRTFNKPSFQVRPGRQKLEAWIRQYGTNSSSYVLLEGSKRYFTSPRVAGFIAYQFSAGVAVIGGDPVCAPEDMDHLLEDFLQVMDGKPICAYQVTPETLAGFR